MTATSSALKLHSPVHIVRPVDDIHTNCERDIEEFCSTTNAFILEDEDGLTDLEIARRLTDTEPDSTYKSRRTSFSIGVKISPKNSNGSVQQAKDNKRFLNYGPKTDTCLWNAFNANQLSSECTSALAYFNNIDNLATMTYGNESEHIKQTQFSVSMPISGILVIILCYVLIQEYDDDEDNNEEDETNDNNVDSEYSEYQVIDESKNESLIAVPFENA